MYQLKTIIIFCGAGIWAQLTWVPLPQGFSQSCNQGVGQGCGLLLQFDQGKSCIQAYLYGCWRDSVPHKLLSA